MSDHTESERLAQVRLELASGYFSMGQVSTALDEVKRALAVKPDFPEALSLRGLIYGQLGEAALAEGSFRRALHLAPRDPNLMHNYAWFLCQQRRWQEADAWFGQATDRATALDVSRSWRARGVCLAAAQRLEGAVDALGRAQQMEPGHPVTAYHLASALVALDRPAAARSTIEAVLQRGETITESGLWLAVRLAHRAGDELSRQHWAGLLQSRFPGSVSARRVAEGIYDE